MLRCASYSLVCIRGLIELLRFVIKPAEGQVGQLYNRLLICLGRLNR